MRSRAVAVGCAVGLALLAGCSAQSEPEATVTSPVAPLPSPATSATQSTAATPGPSAGVTPTAPASATGAAIPVPTPPADMARDDEVGAVAAAEYFLAELYPYVLATRETTTWDFMSDSACNFCRSVSEDAAAPAVETVELAPIRLTYPLSERLEASLFHVGFEIATGPDNYFSPEGTLLRTSSIKTGGVGLNVRYSTERWIVMGVNLVEDGERGR